MGDIDGVTFAAAQALERRTRELPALEAEVARLRAENAAGAERIAALEARAREQDARLARMEALLRQVAGAQ